MRNNISFQHSTQTVSDAKGGSRQNLKDKQAAESNLIFNITSGFPYSDAAIDAIKHAHENYRSFIRSSSRQPKNILSLLNELLEAERAGARITSLMGSGDITGQISESLYSVCKDEAKFCAMLTGHIKRLGGKPSKKTGAFYDKVLSLETFEARLALLNRGQAWVTRRLREYLPDVTDWRLKRDLENMLFAHNRNIQSCDALLDKVK